MTPMRSVTRSATTIGAVRAIGTPRDLEEDERLEDLADLARRHREHEAREEREKALALGDAADLEDARGSTPT